MKTFITKFIGMIVLAISLLACQQKKETDDDYIPLFHFTNGINWTGEPTGLICDDGIYHLFYQYNPSNAMYGNIHWGHAVSQDLFHWEIESIALKPDSLGYLKSGSVIVDKQNTSGWGKEGNSPFIAYYMYENEELEKSIYLAYSQDKGSSWTKYGELILPNEKCHSFRNPHVSWNELLKKWLMTVSSGSSALFYVSSNCIDWSFLYEFEDPANMGVTWLGTDFFSLQVQGKEKQTKWVLLVNMENNQSEDLPVTRYYVGDFDGHSFRITQAKELWLDYGKDNFGGMVFSGVPDGNQIYLGWMNCWDYANLLPTSSWRGNMTIPRQLNLVWEGKHFLISSTIMSNIHYYYGESLRLPPTYLSKEHYLKKDFPYPGEAFIIKLKFDNKDNMAIWKARDYGIRLKTKSGETLSIGYQNELSYYYIDRREQDTKMFMEGFEHLQGVSFRSNAPVIEWNLVFDKNSIELFAGNGCSVITSLCYLKEDFSSFELFAKSGSVSLLEGSITRLEKNKEKVI